MLGDILKKITEKGRDLKIDAISIAAKPILQARVGQCAEIQGLRIDPAKKTISVTALLYGETESIEAEVGYSKTDSGIKVERFQSNRNGWTSPPGTMSSEWSSSSRTSAFHRLPCWLCSVA